MKMKCLTILVKLIFFTSINILKIGNRFFLIIFHETLVNIKAIEEVIVPNSKGRTRLVWSLIIIHFAFCGILSIVSFRTLRQSSSLDNTRVMGTYSEFRKRSDIAWCMQAVGVLILSEIHAVCGTVSKKKSKRNSRAYAFRCTIFKFSAHWPFTRYRCAMICVESVIRRTLKCSHRSFASPNCVSFE